MSILEVKNLSHVYSENTPFARIAIDNVSLKIENGEFIGLVGHTGSGKSTLTQHLNGLLKPTSGDVLVKGRSICKGSTRLTGLRQKVGLVFQYPEHQLFEETVEKDIAFGPINLQLSNDEIKDRVKAAMASVGLDYETFKDSSPFDLSGGQKRRVAIAGVLAMEPEILILDEPTAGLDPRGAREILDEILKIYEERKITIILVSHSMEDVARYTSRMLVMSKGKLVMDGSPRDLFQREDELRSYGLDLPQVKTFMNRLKEKGLEIDKDAITVDEAFEVLKNYLRSKKNA
ncbi:cobalt ABC transporter, ATP-binding protein [Clostridiales bacterium KA00134]|nr:cobalt ABC transporter, ATP-binding protein [Clostridiales bacterium KA00134]